MSHEQRDPLDTLIDRTARSMVAGDAPPRLFITVLATIVRAGDPMLDARVRRPLARWRWEMGIATAAASLLVVSLSWKHTPPLQQPDDRPRPSVVARAVAPEADEHQAPLPVETPSQVRTRARRIEPSIPGPVRFDPVSVAIVEVGPVEISFVEVGRTEVARVELEPTRLDVE